MVAKPHRCCRNGAQRRAEEKEKKRKKEEERKKAADAVQQFPSPAAERVHVHHRVVARLSNDEMTNTKLKDILGSLKSVIKAELLLVGVPPLHQVRNTLVLEFPCASEVIDFALADLVAMPPSGCGRYYWSAIPRRVSVIRIPYCRPISI
jgi:ATP-dependent Lon protease